MSSPVDIKLPNQEPMLLQKKDIESYIEDPNYTNRSELSLQSNAAKDSDIITSEDEEEIILDFLDKQDWDDRVSSCQRKLPLIPPHGYKLQDQFVTRGINNKKSVISPQSKVLGERTISFKELDKVFNRSKVFPSGQEDPSFLADFGVYQYSKVILSEMLNSRLLKKVNGIIRNGAEAFIVHAVIDQNPKGCADQECAIKVLKTPLIKYNYWRYKESANFTKLQKAGVVCPKVIAAKKNFLVMSFIGKNGIAAQSLKDATLTEDEYDLAYNQIVDFIVKLYNEAKLIHCYLTEDNILWYQRQCYIISVRRAISVDEVEANKFLYRDCINVTRFFDHRGVENLKPASLLFKDVCGCDILNEIDFKNI